MSSAPSSGSVNRIVTLRCALHPPWSPWRPCHTRAPRSTAPLAPKRSSALLLCLSVSQRAPIPAPRALHRPKLRRHDRRRRHGRARAPRGSAAAHHLPNALAPSLPASLPRFPVSAATAAPGVAATSLGAAASTLELFVPRQSPPRPTPRHLLPLRGGGPCGGVAVGSSAKSTRARSRPRRCCTILDLWSSPCNGRGVRVKDPVQCDRSTSEPTLWTWPTASLTT
jgi:hypothetical protein